jgi:tetratricopeptide (TPR) repeat protein
MPAGAASPGEILFRLVLLGLVRVQAAEADARLDRQDDSLASEIEQTLRRYEIADYYDILSVAADAGQDAIKAAYHQLARQYHPDLFQGDRFGAAVRRNVERLFTYITAAYTTLGDPAARAVYDEQRLVAGSKLEAALHARAGADTDKEMSAGALFRIGQQLMAGQNFEKAVLTLGECVFLKPEVSKYRRALAYAQTEIPRHRKDAEQNLLKAIELDPMDLESYVALGQLYLRVNLPRRAEAQFRHVLRLDPGNREAEKGLKALAAVSA